MLPLTGNTPVHLAASVAPESPRLLQMLFGLALHKPIYEQLSTALQTRNAFGETAMTLVFRCQRPASVAIAVLREQPTLVYNAKGSTLALHQRIPVGSPSCPVATALSNCDGSIIKVLEKCNASMFLVLDTPGKESSLHMTIAAKRSDALEQVLEYSRLRHPASFNLHYTDSNGFTALHYAALFNDAASIKALIALGAKVNAVVADQTLPLPTDSALVVGERFDTGHSPLTLAAQHDCVAAAEELVRRIANLNHQTSLRRASALMLAARNANKQLVEFLIDSSAQLELRDKHGCASST
jgi:ankyrin repeat protein